MATTTKETYYDLGMANDWTETPKKLKACLQLQHNHRSIELTKDLHRNQCDQCKIEWMERGKAPAIPRQPPSGMAFESPTAPPAVDIQTIVAAVLAALDAREAAKLKK